MAPGFVRWERERLGRVIATVSAAAGAGRVRLPTAMSAARMGVTLVSSSSNYGQLNVNATSITAAGNFSTSVAADLGKDGLEQFQGWCRVVRQ